MHSKICYLGIQQDIHASKLTFAIWFTESSIANHPSAREQMILALYFSLFSTNDAGQFIMINVRLARQGMITITLYYVQKSPFCVFFFLASWHSLRLYVNANKFTRMGMVVVRGHQIPIILSGPTWGTLVRSRNHHLWATWSNVTHSARCIMLIKIPSCKAREWCLVLGTVYSCSTLPSTLVFVVNGFVGETDVVGATTGVSVVSTAHWACNERHKDKMKYWPEQQSEER